MTNFEIASNSKVVVVDQKTVDKFVELVESLKAKNKKFDDEQDEDRQATEAANKARADLDR